MIEVKMREGLGQATYAQMSIKQDDLVYDFRKALDMKKRTRFTIESNHGHHLDKNIMFINHSCNPNCYINKFEAKIYALRDIEQGDEITFDYNHNESAIENPFDCKCGAKNCRGRIGKF